ncbi:Transcription factor SFL1 [Apiospora arundinis]
MALVDYSDSDSDSESVTQPAPTPASTAQAQTNPSKQPVQKVVDRANPRKILVSLPGASKSDESNSTAKNGDEPSAKRAKTTGGGAFSGFASFLPPPKNASKATAPAATSAAKSAPRRPGINLKTGAAPGFSRNTDLNDYEDGEGSTSQQQAQPSIPAGQKPADEVKLVGKPMMFKPLSVSRKPAKKKNTVAKTTAATTTTTTTTTAKAGLATESPSQAESQSAPESAEPPKKKKKIALFSIDQEEPADAAPSSGAYEPMFTTREESAETESAEAFAAYDAQHGGGPSSYPDAPTASSSASLGTLAAGMNLSKAARRELFGRSGAPPDLASAGAPSVINFNTDKEYAHNEELRASGEQQTFNPVRAIAPGKHSLRQLVTQVHNQREALEESFAKGKSNQREAGSRYGWR